jgi:hypothetical protein
MIELPLSKGYIAVIDDCDADIAKLKWCARMGGPDHNYPYGYRQAGSKPFRGEHLHRAILERAIRRPLEKGEIVDHIDGNTLNNCRSNLRLATAAENQRNRRLSKRNTTGYKGVSYVDAYDKWTASIKTSGRLIHLGTFATAEQAFEARNEAALLYHGEFAHSGTRPLRLADAPVATRQLSLFDLEAAS